MKEFYPSTAPMMDVYEKNGAISPIFLASEQIILHSTPKNAKKEHNAVIRLAASIEKYGILEPLLVKLSPRNDGFPLYELIDGERRFRAAALLGIPKLPCVILAPNDKKCLKLTAIRAILQENLHFFALAEAFLQLINQYQMTQEEIADRVGLSQSAVANKLRLLRLTPEERRLIVSGGLTERHARTFLRISDPKIRTEALTIALREGYNVARTEALVQQYIHELGKGTQPKNSRDLSKNSPKTTENGLFDTKNGDFEPERPQKAAEKRPHNVGITPNTFVLRDLKPLYTSIERTLGIFEKTGVCAEYHKEEDENYAHITIRIPK
jgi:ParB family chromosome partitioning protein